MSTQKCNCEKHVYRSWDTESELDVVRNLVIDYKVCPKCGNRIKWDETLVPQSMMDALLLMNP